MSETEDEKRATLARFAEWGFPLIMWAENADGGVGDAKGPREIGWQKQLADPGAWQPGVRVGALTGVEISKGKFLHDVDIDWAPASAIATELLPPSDFVYGRPSKKVSHVFYTLPSAVPTQQFRDIDGSMIIEARGAKSDGSVGMQSMLPPSTWSKDGRREDLVFVRRGPPTHYSEEQVLSPVRSTAIGAIIAKHLGEHGFGHEARLCWAGYLLRLGLSEDELVAMGRGMSAVCDNAEVADVATVVRSTAKNLASAANKKVKGGPALARLIGPKGRAVLARIEEWLGRDRDFEKNKTGGIYADSQDNVRRAVAMLEIELGYDSFAEKAVARESGGPWFPLDDVMVTRTRFRIDREFKFRPTKEFFRDAMEDMAHDGTFHPVRDWLASLKWDGTKRIDRFWIEYCGAIDNEYVRATARLFFVAAVRRARAPGAKFDEMPILESVQGFEKSSLFRALLPDDSWFSDDLPLYIDAKEVIERTVGKWIIEASDLSGKSRTDVEQLKAMLSRQVDGPARMAYAHMPVERRRQFVIAGTTNKKIYLSDMTGGRRFWPIEVGRVALTKVAADRDQLWAEAAAAEATGESIRLAEWLWPAAAREQEARREHDAWEDELVAIIARHEPGADGKRRVTAKALWNALGIPAERRARAGSLRLAEIMLRLGFKCAKVRPLSEETQAGYVQMSADPTFGGVREGEDDLPSNQGTKVEF